MTEQTYLNKVYGGLLGKCLGGAAGATVEGIKSVIPHEHYRELLRTGLPNDDLDLQLLWLQVLEEKGIDITSRDLADAWEKYCWYPFNEYGIFLRNYERGIYPPYSGCFNNPVFKESEGCPIRSEIWGMVFNGKPQKAAEYAKMDAVLDHAGAAVQIEQFYAAMEAEAFYESDIKKLIHNQIQYLPKGTRARSCVELMLAAYQLDNDWLKARVRLMREYAHFDFSNAVTNLGIVILALLYGHGDMDETINIAFRCGFDTDSTCATAGALLGIILGIEQIPIALRELVGDTLVMGIALKHENRSIREVAEKICQIGRKTGDADNTNSTNQSEGIRSSIKLRYLNRPALGVQDICRIMLTIKNDSDMEKSGILEVSQLPEGWNMVRNHIRLWIEPHNEKQIRLSFYLTDKTEILQDKNILMASFAGEELYFGICGAAVWQVLGPYFEGLDKPEPEGLPKAHGENSVLPTLECMVNNTAELDRLYIDEAHLTAAFAEEEAQRINVYEDLFPIDETFPFYGQGCLYLRRVLFSPEEREVWLVIGNNDGFKLWINQEQVMEMDEIRLWTPYNNYSLVHLKKGKNELVLKLLKRTESLKFSMGIRKYDGKHFHKKRWYVDFGTAL